MNDRVDFVCARPEHQGSKLDDALTMHEDRWAYCPTGAHEHHDWRATGGMSLEDTKGFLRQQDVARDQRSD